MELGFEFEHPWVLLLLAALPLYAWLRGRVGRTSALLFPDAALLAGLSRRVREGAGGLRLFLRLATAALLIVALAGPRTASKEIERETEGVDILLVVDLSWSMMALDMSPPGKETTRWEASQQVIREFLSRRPDDRVGAVVFSGKPYLLSPLTINKGWIEKGVDRMHIGIIQETGTAIGEALAMGVDRMKTVKGKGSKVIILLTDGIGLGKDEPTILPQFDRRTGKLNRDVFGKIIPMMTMNPANYEMLEKMAKIGQGRFYRALDRDQLQRVYEEIDRLERTEVKIRETVTYESHRRAWMLAALLFLLAELLGALVRPRAP